MEPSSRIILNTSQDATFHANLEHSEEAKPQSAVIGDPSKLEQLEEHVIPVRAAASECFEAQAHTHEEAAPLLEHGRVWLINKPKLGKIEKLENAHSIFGAPTAIAVGGALGFVDPTGITSVAVNVVDKSIGVYEAGKNRHLHGKWVSKINPMAPALAHLDKTSLKEQFSSEINRIMSVRDDIQTIKKDFEALGMPIDTIKTLKELQKKLNNSKFETKLFNNFTRQQESIANAQALLGRSKAQFDANVEKFEEGGMSAEEAKAAAHEATTEKAVTGGINRTLAGTVKKIHSIHRHFLNFTLVRTVAQLGATITTGLVSIAVKISVLAGGITAPIGLTVTLPLILVPLTIKVVSGGIRLAVVSHFRPETTKEHLRMVDIKKGAQDIKLGWHRAWYRDTLGKMNDLQETKFNLTQKLKEAELTEKKSLNIQNKIGKIDRKMEKLINNNISRIEKINASRNKSLDLQQRLIDAGWTDAQAFLKLIPTAEGDYAEQLGAWIFTEYENNRLNPETDKFLKKQMAIDVDQMAKTFPGQEAKAITHHIKEYFAKDEDQMLDLIKSQRRKQKKSHFTDETIKKPPNSVSSAPRSNRASTAGA